MLEEPKGQTWLIIMLRCRLRVDMSWDRVRRTVERLRLSEVITSDVDVEVCVVTGS